MKELEIAVKEVIDAGGSNTLISIPIMYGETAPSTIGELNILLLSGVEVIFVRSAAILSYANLNAADLSNADLTGVNWYYTTCPDGTNSDDNGNTCENNL